MSAIGLMIALVVLVPLPMAAWFYDLEERKILMGHESIRTTEHYYGRVTVEDVARKIVEVGL